MDAGTPQVCSIDEDQRADSQEPWTMITEEEVSGYRFRFVVRADGRNEKGRFCMWGALAGRIRGWCS